MAEEKEKEQHSWKDFLFGTSYMEYMMHFIAGMFILILGVTAITGGGISIQATAESEPKLIDIGTFPAWILWLFVWTGFDTALFRGKLTNLVTSGLSKAIAPVFRTLGEATIGEEKLSAWEQKIKEVRSKLNNEGSSRD